MTTTNDFISQFKTHLSVLEIEDPFTSRQTSTKWEELTNKILQQMTVCNRYVIRQNTNRSNRYDCWRLLTYYLIGRFVCDILDDIKQNRDELRTVSQFNSLNRLLLSKNWVENRKKETLLSLLGHSFQQQWGRLTSLVNSMGNPGAQDQQSQMDNLISFLRINQQLMKTVAKFLSKRLELQSIKVRCQRSSHYSDVKTRKKCRTLQPHSADKSRCYQQASLSHMEQLVCWLHTWNQHRKPNPLLVSHIQKTTRREGKYYQQHAEEGNNQTILELIRAVNQVSGLIDRQISQGLNRKDYKINQKLLDLLKQIKSVSESN